MKRLFSIACLAISMALLPPATTGCKSTLAPGGAYAPAGTQPDMAFFAADAAYQIAWNTINAAFDFERNNREYLFRLSPEVKHTLDSLRPNAVTANSEYLKAREAYKLNPVPDNLTALQSALAKIKQLLPAVTAVLPKG